MAGNVVKHIDSPIAPVDSSSGSAQSEMSTSGVMSEEINSRGDPETNTGEMAMSNDLSFYLLTAWSELIFALDPRLLMLNDNIC